MMTRLALMTGVCLLLAASICYTSGAFDAPGVMAQQSAGGSDSEIARIPFRRHMNVALLEMRIGESEPLTLMLDCGSSQSLLDAEIADRLELDMTRSRQGGRTSAGGQFSMRTAPRVSVEVGEYSTELTNVTIAQFQKSARVIMGETVHGVIGQPFFKNATLEFDYVAEEIIVHDPKKYRYTGSGSELKIEFDPTFGNLPFTYVTFESSKGAEHSVKIFIDSGGVVATTAAFGSPSTIKDVISADAPRTPAMGATGVADSAEDTMHSAFVARAHRMRIGPYGFERPVIACHNNMPHNSFGAELMHRFDVVFDYERDRVIVEPNDLFDTPIKMDASGMMLIAAEGDADARQVMFVVPDSPAARAGINQGDAILKINGEPVQSLGLAATRDFFCEVDKEHTLEMKRGDEVFTATFRTRELY